MPEEVCPYNCSYCFNKGYKKMYSSTGQKYLEIRSVNDVISECIEIKKDYNVKNLVFNDSTFCYNKKWTIKFLKKYKEKVNMPFSINATVKDIDEEICKAVSATEKCYNIRIGLETGNEKLRKEVLKKNISNKQYVKATNLLKKYKINYQLNIMMDIPTETLENAFETLDFAIKIGDRNKTTGTTIFKPYAKLDITNFGLKIKEYKKEIIQNDHLIGNEVVSVFHNFRNNKESELIIKLCRLAQIYIHFPLFRKLIKKKLIYFPDNSIYKFIYFLGEYYYSTRAITNASWKYIIKYLIKHIRKGIVFT